MVRNDKNDNIKVETKSIGYKNMPKKLQVNLERIQCIDLFKQFIDHRYFLFSRMKSQNSKEKNQNFL